MTKTLTALTLIVALTSCSRESYNQSEIVPRVTIQIEGATYRALLIDSDGDGINDELSIKRNLASYDWKTFRGVKEEYFVTSLPQNPSPLPPGVVVNVVKPGFFKQYDYLFTPNRDYVTSTYGEE